jgi:hypothetical protein
MTMPPASQAALLRVPQTFDLRPSTRSTQSATTLLGYPDELMIDWGNTPQGSKVQVYWPQASSSDVVRLAMALYATEPPRAVDLNTIECTVTSRVTFIPIPFGTVPKFAGLFTLDLPPGVTTDGQEFNIVVRRLATHQPPATVPSPVIQVQRAARPSINRNWRYVVGTFQITIPVQAADQLLVPVARTLSIMKWRLQQTPIANRWYPVLKRYVSYLIGSVSALGLNPGEINPSPIGFPLPITLSSCEDTIEHTGKVCEVLFDCFGDFEGFVLDVCCSESIRFKTRESGIANLVLRACRDRLLLSVFVERGSAQKICKLAVRC